MRERTTQQMALQRMPEPFNPFGLMRRLTKDMERWFEGFQGFEAPKFFQTDFLPFRTEFENIDWIPPMEVVQNNGEFMVRADLPGLTKDDVKIEVTDKLMTISGERKEESEEKREGFYTSERRYGSFFRQVRLPEGVTPENIAATFHNGVLEITMPMPKVEETKRQIEIKEPIKEKVAKASA